MQVKDVMQTNVAWVGPDDAVSAAAKIMVARRVSGLPVVDNAGAVVGIVTEGDFLRRTELGRSLSRSWWLDLIGGGITARDVVHAHAKYVKDAMSKNVHVIAPDASLAAAAMALESEGVKRLPVVADGHLVGVVSRADLVRAFASVAPKTPEATPSDSDIRKAVRQALSKEPGMPSLQVTVLARNGEIELWGLADTQEEIDAARVTAEQVPGVRAVKSRIKKFPATYFV